MVKDLREHNFARLLRQGVAVTINSDDPAYFGGYIADNYRATATALELTNGELVQVAENAVRASFLPAPAKATLLGRIRTEAARAEPGDPPARARRRRRRRARVRARGCGCGVERRAPCSARSGS